MTCQVSLTNKAQARPAKQLAAHVLTLLTAGCRCVLLLLCCPIACLAIWARTRGALLRCLTVAGGCGSVWLLSTCSKG